MTPSGGVGAGAGGGNVRVVVRVRAFLPRGELPLENYDQRNWKWSCADCRGKQRPIAERNV